MQFSIVMSTFKANITLSTFVKLTADLYQSTKLCIKALNCVPVNVKCLHI